MRSRDPGFRRLLELAERAAATDANVLITGASGTGKSRLARFIHEHSRRADGPFVEVPCANLPDELLESELFGHRRGAFTGAHEDRVGRFEYADGGTVFLDDVPEMRPEIQAKVLRVLQERRFEPLGGTDTVEVDVRIVASAREDPDRLVADGRLREDLYYRLNVVRLDLPTLSERGADIPVLAQAFLEEACHTHELEDRTFDDAVLERLAAHDWPGNVRELQHAIESAALMATGATVELGDLPDRLTAGNPAVLRSAAARGWTLRELETAYIREVLRRTRGNKSAAARILGIHRKTLHDKLRAIDSDDAGENR